MGFFDFIFGSKPNAFDIKAYNYHLFFEFIPKNLHLWEEMNISFDSVIYFKHLINNNKQWKSLVKHTKVTSSGINQNQDITLYLITAPSNEQYGEVDKAIIAINKKLQKSVYYILEYSFEDFAICSTDESGNHFYIDKCKNANQFGAYVIKAALETLVPPKSQHETQQNPKKQEQSSSQSNTKYTAESFLKVLENLADQYYKKRGVVSLEDWIVTQKVGDEFKFYITQNPDMEFEDPNCEVTLMVDFMGHNERMKVVEKFFTTVREQGDNKKPTSDIPKIDPPYPSALADKYYSLDQLRQIPMGGLRLQPIDAGIVFDKQQQAIVSLFAQKSPRIKRFLPNLNLSSSEDVEKYFSVFCQKTEMQLEFGYSIKMNKHGDVGYMGFIFVHTPLFNNVAINFPQWTIDFCIFEPLEGKGFMRTPLRHIMLMLKNEMGVKNLFAIVDEDNIQCQNFMKSLPFRMQPETLTDPTTGKKANLFLCPLSQIEIDFKSKIRK